MKKQVLDGALLSGCVITGHLDDDQTRVLKVENNQKREYKGNSLDNAFLNASIDLALTSGEIGRDWVVTLNTRLARSLNELDRWLLLGNLFILKHDGTNISCRLVSRAHVKIPSSVEKKVINHGRRKTWSFRGYTYETVREYLPNHKGPSTNTRVIAKPPGVDNETLAWSFLIERTGKGAEISEAVSAAIEAEEIEVTETE